MRKQSAQRMLALLFARCARAVNPSRREKVPSSVPPAPAKTPKSAKQAKARSSPPGRQTAGRGGRRATATSPPTSPSASATPPVHNRALIWPLTVVLIMGAVVWQELPMIGHELAEYGRNVLEATGRVKSAPTFLSAVAALVVGLIGAFIAVAHAVELMIVNLHKSGALLILRTLWLATAAHPISAERLLALLTLFFS